MSSWPNPPVALTRFSGVRATVIRQEPDQASAADQTWPVSSVVVPSSSISHGEAWWLDTPRRLVSTVSAYGSRMRWRRFSAPQPPIAWERRQSGLSGRTQQAESARSRAIGSLSPVWRSVRRRSMTSESSNSR